jgi:hypothetical protein
LKSEVQTEKWMSPPEIADAGEVRFHSPGADPSKTAASCDEGIKELLSTIERKLPNVAEASQDLQALRALFNLQLVDAAALRLEFPDGFGHTKQPAAWSTPAHCNPSAPLSSSVLPLQLLSGSP